MHTEFW